MNLLIGLAVLVGVSFVLFGALGGKRTSGFNPPPASRSEGNTGLAQLDMAAGIVGPSSSQPPPIPGAARFAPVPMSTRQRQRLSNPSGLVEERWERARKRIRSVFGGGLAPEKESAVQNAVATWVAMQAQAVEAFHGGYIDQHGLGLHSGWNRNVYMLSLQDALGNSDFQRYAGGGVELGEIEPGL
ncbi:MAG TPA: hypothetical protein VM261_26675 [Kofleriaceae bacterium]|nr:hypothetical protein [Kofleriaceae bacterium]